MSKAKFTRFIIAAADPIYKHVSTLDLYNKSSVDSIIKMASKNGLFCMVMEKLKDFDVDLSDYNDRIVKEKENLLDLKKTIEIIKKVTAHEKIDYVIIKACSSIKHVPRDVDMFINNEDRSRMIKLLESEGMKCVQNDITETALKGEHMKLDIYTEICYFGVDFIGGDFLLKSKDTDNMVGVSFEGLNADASFLLMLVHSIFGHRSMSLLDFLHLKNIRADVDIDLCREYANSRGWGKVFDMVNFKLGEMIEKHYSRGEILNFPCLFDSEFVLKCLGGIEGFEISITQKLFFHITFVQDRIIYELNDTSLYNFVKSHETLRNLANSLTASVKRLRGDKKSTNKRE